MKTLLSVIIFSFILLSCGPSSDQNRPDIYAVADDDSEMNAAIEEAQSTLPEFNLAIESNNPEFTTFAIKKKFDTPAGPEHIWISDIEFTNGNYFGIVDNIPESTSQVKIGDKIKIDIRDISDWMYLNGGSLVGGYTIRVLRKRMSEPERLEFDEGSGIIIN